MPLYLKRVQRNPRARRNMAFPKIVTLADGTTVEVDDMAELLAITSRSVMSTKKQGRKAREAAFTAAATTPARKKKSNALFPDLREYKYNGMYRVLSRYVGGQKAFCPALKAMAVAKKLRLSNVEAFRAMGVEPDMASALLDHFSAAHDNLDTLSASQAAKNLDYMMSQPGVACPTTKSNPRHRRW
jgi:hypothetical protein